MMVNGVPKLTCAAFLKDYYPNPVRVEPLSNFPVIRDLVVNIDDFLHKLKEVKAWLIPKEEKPVSQGEYLQTPAELAHYKQFSMCINCMLCYAACPVYGLEPKFLGPAAIALAQRYNLDSRDGAAEERKNVIAASEGIWECTFVGECTEVCPKHVDPAGAIQQAKVQAGNQGLRHFLVSPENHDHAGREVEEGHAMNDREDESDNMQRHADRRPQAFVKRGEGLGPLPRPVQEHHQEHAIGGDENAGHIANHELEVGPALEPPRGRHRADVLFALVRSEW